DAIANLLDSWDRVEQLKAKREVEARPKPKRFGMRGFLVEKPRRVEAEPANDVGPQIDPASNVSGEAKLARLMEITRRVKLTRTEPEPEEVEEEVEPVVDVDADAARIGRALVPVKRFASRIILPDVAQVSQVLETVRLVNLKHQIVGNYGGRCMVVSWERWPVNPKFLVPTFQKVSDFKNR